MSEEPEVIARVEGQVGRLTLNRPRALNALTTDMCLRVSAALRAWAADDGVKAVLIDHAGERAFCAGGDVRIVAESGKGDGTEARRFFLAEYRMNHQLFAYPKPTAAVMDGITMGGGVGISMPARWRVATERTTWAMPEGDIGLFPDVGAGWHLARLPGRVGLWLALTGARLGGPDCAALGIATHLMTSAEAGALRQDPARLFERLAGRPGSTPLQAPILARLADIDRLFGEDTVEAILQALAADGSDWASEQRRIIERKCPTTLKVALRLIREGARRSGFAEEMELEYRIAVRMSRRHDFIEGVRAVLVDKDNAPRWDPPTPTGVTNRLVDGIFAPLPPGEAWTPAA